MLVHVTSQWFESVSPPSACVVVPVNGRSATTAYKRKLVPSGALRHGVASMLPERKLGSIGSGGTSGISVADPYDNRRVRLGIWLKQALSRSGLT